MLSPPTTNTSPNCTISPGLPLTFSTLITSSAATRYCLPPVLMTANMALSSVRYGGRVDGPASFHLSAFPGYPRFPDGQSARSPPPPLSHGKSAGRRGVLMAVGPETVKETGPWALDSGWVVRRGPWTNRFNLHLDMRFPYKCGKHELAMSVLADHPFVKMNGLGNEIVVVDMRAQTAIVAASEARAAAQSADTAYDQLMALHAPRTPGTDAYVRIYNNDGSESGACGNGMRCVSEVLFKETGKSALTLETRAGLLTCWKGDRPL